MLGFVTACGIGDHSAGVPFPGNSPSNRRTTGTTVALLDPIPGASNRSNRDAKNCDCVELFDNILAAERSRWCRHTESLILSLDHIRCLVPFLPINFAASADALCESGLLCGKRVPPPAEPRI